MHTFQTDADAGRAYEAKGFKVTFSNDNTATVECFLDAPMLIEPVVVLRVVDGFRICKTSMPPKVWVLEPGEKTYGGGCFDNEQAAVEGIRERVKQIKANRRRIAGEKTVVRRVVKDMLAKGYSMSIEDPDEGGWMLKKSKKFSEIMANLMQCDDERLYIHRDGMKTGVVYFVYGNDSWEVICDHSVSLEDDLKGAFEVCERLEKRGR